MMIAKKWRKTSNSALMYNKRVIPARKSKFAWLLKYTLLLLSCKIRSTSYSYTPRLYNASSISPVCFHTFPGFYCTVCITLLFTSQSLPCLFSLYILSQHPHEIVFYELLNNNQVQLLFSILNSNIMYILGIV